MTNQAEIGAIVAEYAVAHRELRLARGYQDFNLDAVVEFACQDLLNLYKRCGTHQTGLETIRDELAFEREILARIKSEASA